MPDEPLTSAIGLALCSACAARTDDAQARLANLVRQALRSAEAEIGALPQRPLCPRSGKPDAACPLVSGQEDLSSDPTRHCGEKNGP